MAPIKVILNCYFQNWDGGMYGIGLAQNREKGGRGSERSGSIKCGEFFE
jgi:hypothetical protein